jgi:nitrogen fixation/metabolism regulation signal transduction histidine kinase
MKIGIKLTVGVLFLFFQFILVAFFSAYFIYNISEQVKAIMKNNNLSIMYAEIMLQQVDHIQTIETSVIFNPDYISNENEMIASLNKFDENLKMQESNTTEIGEKELTYSLRNDFDKYRALTGLPAQNRIKNNTSFYFSNLIPQYQRIKTVIYAISDMNMQAIERKTDNTGNTASNSYIFISLVTTVFFIVSFTFLFNFPGSIANPVKELSEGIRQLAGNNYNVRLVIDSRDEFGDISRAFNTLAADLESRETGKSGGEKRKLIPESRIPQNRRPPELSALLQRHLGLIKSNLDLLSKLNIDMLFAEQTEIVKNLKEELERYIEAQRTEG